MKHEITVLLYTKFDVHGSFTITGKLFTNLFREDKLLERAKGLKVNAGTEPDADLGPVISKQACAWFSIYLFIFTENNGILIFGLYAVFC